MDKPEQQALAKTLLVHSLGLPDGVASAQVDAFSDEQLAEVCAAGSTPLRFRRQVLKATLTKISEAAARAPTVDVVSPPAVTPAVAAPDPAAPDPESAADVAEPDDTVVVDEP